MVHEVKMYQTTDDKKWSSVERARGHQHWLDLVQFIKNDTGLPDTAVDEIAWCLVSNASAYIARLRTEIITPNKPDKE